MTPGAFEAPARTPEAGEVFYDGAWCWWTGPRAFRHGSRIYLAALTSRGMVGIGTTSNERYLLQPYLHQDDHNNPALLMKTGKQPLIFYCKHNVDALLRYRIGTTADEITSWGDEQTITLPDLTTYAIAMYYGDEVFVFTRLTTKWVVLRSTGWGTGWQDEVELFDLGTGNQAYLATKLLADGVTVRCAATGNPRESVTVHDVYYFEINLATGAVTESDGTVLGNIRTGASLPLTTSTMELAYDTPVDRTTNLFDVGDGPIPEIVFGEKDADDASTTNAEYRYARLVSGTWATKDIVAAGTKFGYEHNGFYIGGASFPAPSAGGIVYLSRESAGTWTIEKHTTADNGDTWSSSVLATSTDRKLIRPYPVKDRESGDPEVVYMGASFYDDTTFNYWQSNLYAV